MNNRIYMFANFGDWHKQPYGGGEVGNRRTLSLLKKAGYDVKLIEKYKRVNSHSAINLVLLLVKMVSNILKFSCILLVGRRKKSIVHVVGFYGAMVYFEDILVAIAKALHYKVVYEMRGGGAALYYKEGTKRYRKTFNHLICSTDVIFSQGLENRPLIYSIQKRKEVYYYPNFVMDDFYPKSFPTKPMDRINIMYFGRVSKTKNVEVAIDAFIKIASKYENAYLDIVGNCPEPKYADMIRNKIAASGYADRVKMYPACNHAQLKVHLKDKHFYLFPTSEPHEGHSNAMTEAMAWGLIPIATAQGFNRSVVNNDNLIVNELSSLAFSKAIEKILEKNKLTEYSNMVYQRVMDNYTEKRAYINLREEYSKLFNN